MANKYYIGASAGTWNTPGNWSGGLPAAGDDIFVTGNIGANSFINVNTVIPTINSLTIGDGASPFFRWYLAGTAATTAGTSVWTLTGSQTTISVTSGPYTTSSLIPDATLNIPISGSGKIVKTGPGALSFETAAAATWTGGIDLLTGSVGINNANNKLGTGPINLYNNTGLFNVNTGTTYSLQNNIILVGNSVYFNNTTSAQLTLAGNVDLGSGTKTITNNTALLMSGIVSGSADLIKSGSGTLSLSRVNTNTGGATVAVGSVSIGADSGLGSNTTASLTLVGTTLTNTGSAFATNRNITLTNNTSNTIDGPITINNSIAGGGNLSHTTGELILNASNSIGNITLGISSTISANHSNSLGGSGLFTFSGDNARLKIYQNTTLNKTYVIPSGIWTFIGAYSGSTLTLTSGASGSLTSYLQQTQGIIQTNTSAPFSGTLYIQPDANTAIGTTIFRDTTANATGIPLQRTIFANGILELSASTFSRIYGDSVGTIRTGRSGDTNFSAANTALGQGFSSINPNGTNVTTNITFQAENGGSTSLWSGPVLFGTAYGTSIGKTTLSGLVNLNGISQTFYVFTGSNENGSSAEISGIISDSTGLGSLTKQGSGKLILSAKNTYIGATNVNNGTLEVKYIGLQYGSGSSTVGDTITISDGCAYRYVGSGSQTYSSLSIYNNSAASTLLVDGIAGGYIPSLTLNGYSFDTVISGSGGQNVVMEVDSLLGNATNFILSGSNTWKITGLHSYRSTNTTLLSGSKMILSTEHVGAGVSLGTGTTSVAAGATLETVSGEVQSGKVKYNGHLTLGTAGSGAVKAKYKIGNGAVKDAGATTASSFTFSTPTNVVLSNAAIYNGPGEYVLYKYTNTLTGFENLNVTTNIAGRYVSHVRHNTNLKRVYVTLS